MEPRHPSPLVIFKVGRPSGSKPLVGRGERRAGFRLRARASGSSSISAPPQPGARSTSGPAGGAGCNVDGDGGRALRSIAAEGVGLRVRHPWRPPSGETDQAQNLPNDPERHSPHHHEVDAARSPLFQVTGGPELHPVGPRLSAFIYRPHERDVYIADNKHARASRNSPWATCDTGECHDSPLPGCIDRWERTWTNRSFGRANAAADGS